MQSKLGNNNVFSQITLAEDGVKLMFSWTENLNTNEINQNKLCVLAFGNSYPKPLFLRKWKIALTNQIIIVY